MPVKNASPEFQLAVDLIYLLECNEVAPEVVLAAIEIVKRDYQNKLEHRHCFIPTSLGNVS